MADNEEGSKSEPAWRFLVKVVVVPIVLAIIAAPWAKDVWESLRAPPDTTLVGMSYQIPPGRNSSSTPQLYTDTWTIKSKDGQVSGFIRKDDSTNPDAKWIVQGVLKNSRYAVSYSASRVEDNGIGTYYLEKINGKNEYRGSYAFLDCDAGNSFVCPYLLVPASDRQIASSLDEERKDFLKVVCQPVQSAVKLSCKSGV